jgi:hypothetical protein
MGQHYKNENAVLRFMANFSISNDPMKEKRGIKKYVYPIWIWIFVCSQLLRFLLILMVGYGEKFKTRHYRDVSTGATGATVVAPKLSDTLTLCQPGKGADSAHHRRGRT